MRVPICLLALVLLAACGSTTAVPVNQTAPTPADELDFRDLRRDYHQACTTGDRDGLRDRLADDAVLRTTDGTTVEGGEQIADYFTNSTGFGNLLVVTPESSWWVLMRVGSAEFGFESVSIDVGSHDPFTIQLAASDAQHPDVEIVEHTHSFGRAVRDTQGNWVFQELRQGTGPLPPAPPLFEGVQGDASGLLDIASADELGFRRMRQDFHLANMIGSEELMWTVWAQDAVFRGGPNEHFGAAAIVDFFVSDPTFGLRLNLTPEHSAETVVNGDIIEYGFECISVDLGGRDPRTTVLASGGSQNPAVEIVWHSNSTGLASRVPGAGARWVFQEFNGAQGPLTAP